MLLVNLYGDAGSGKTTGAAYVFSKLKLAGVKCELVQDVAKEKILEDNVKAMRNQAYIFGEQYFRLSRLEDEVDVVVTDSPLLLESLYSDDERLGNAFKKVILNVAKSYDSIDFFVKPAVYHRGKKGKIEEDELSEFSKKVIVMLEKHFPGYMTVDGNKTGYDRIVKEVFAAIDPKSKKKH